MKFSELESIMLERGIGTLADIARFLETTPQAVSNWKSRDQVPYHIIALINSANFIEKVSFGETQKVFTSAANKKLSSLRDEEIKVSPFDILLTIAEQLKIVLLIPFIFVFFTFTYAKFIKAPKYTSQITLLTPDAGASKLGGLAGLASQFGVDVPAISQADLSNPVLFPELIKSRRFAEKILYKEFYTKKYDKKLPLLSILTDSNDSILNNSKQDINKALNELSKMIAYDQDPKSSFSIIKITASEPIFAKELAEVVLKELESLNRFFKSQAVSEKITFIDNRIKSVSTDLKKSEKLLNAFKEQNRQTTSPALQLENDRFERDVEVQKEIYLTLKQQLELAKIEEIQESSILQVLDGPQVSISPSNSNTRTSVILSSFAGIIIGVIIGFIRSYFNNVEMADRKKLRRFKSFINKKGKDFLVDRRISGIVSLMLLLGLPFYLGWESQIPIFFGKYSTKAMIIVTFYVSTLLLFSTLFIYRTKTKK